MEERNPVDEVVITDVPAAAMPETPEAEAPAIPDLAVPAVEPPAPPSEIPESPSASPHYHQAGTWNGYPQFRCAYCPFEALSEPDIVEHVKTHIETRLDEYHRSTTGLVDLQGNPL